MTTKNHPHIIENVEDWPISRFYSDRPRVVKLMNEYTYDKFSAMSATEVESALASTIYQEKIRVKTNPWKVDPTNEYQYWKKLESEINKNSNLDNKAELNLIVLKKIINRYSEEIAGNFIPKTFLFARNILTSFFKRIYNRGREKGSWRPWGNRELLLDKIKCYGEIRKLRSLFDKGTVVIVPNHYSNLDSILMGYVIDSKIGIPAFSYGAGLNLYDMELVAYFINRLGAYKLDRRKKNPIYLASLKTFSAVSLLDGVNNIFYPGGTRSRSGEFEKNIKYGLFGTMVEAQRHLCQRGSDKKIFVVPMTVGYHFTLEAKSLIQQHLAHEGKEKFIKDSKDKDKGGSLFNFIKKMWSKNSEVIFNFGTPMDVFGNEVDESGKSFDKRNIALKVEDYFKHHGELTVDEQREYKYTSILGAKILKSFKTEHVILGSHVLAFVAFEVFHQENKNLDIFSLLRLPSEDLEIPYDQFKIIIGETMTMIKEKEKEGQLICEDSFALDPEEFIIRSLHYLGGYHKQRPLKISKGMIKTEDSKLLYYYHNRLVGYGMAAAVKDSLSKTIEIA